MNSFPGPPGMTQIIVNGPDTASSDTDPVPSYNLTIGITVIGIT
jgi:hypothetical protein